MPYISLKNIHKKFDGLAALKDISLCLSMGEVVGLVGDNGAGKSTLVKVISGSLHPSEGKIFLEESPVNMDSPATARDLGIEVVHQDLALCGNLTASENIYMGRELRYFRSLWAPLRRKQMRTHAKALLNTLKSDSNIDAPVATMSGGQRQAVAIARTLLSNAKLVIMDEPLAAISVRQVEEVLTLIKNLKKEGKAILLVTHRLDDVFAVCDRILVMRRGEIVADRPVQEFSTNELTGLITGAIQ